MVSLQANFIRWHTHTAVICLVTGTALFVNSEHNTRGMNEFDQSLERKHEEGDGSVAFGRKLQLLTDCWLNDISEETS